MNYVPHFHSGAVPALAGTSTIMTDHSRLRFVSILPMAAAVTLVLFLAMRSMITMESVELTAKIQIPPLVINPTVTEIYPRIREHMMDKVAEVTPPPERPMIEQTHANIPDAPISNGLGAIPKFDQKKLLHSTSAIHLDRSVQPILRVPPIYPGTALSRGLEGSCKALLDVGLNGRPMNISVTCTDQIFERAARRSIAKWKYAPKMVDGKAVIMRGVGTDIKFRISK